MSALLLAPHNDDETLFAFHTLTRSQAHVVVVLRSYVEAERGGPGFLEREDETHCAMTVAGASWKQWTYPDNAPNWIEIESRIRAVAEDYDVLIAPAWEAGGHEHHNEIARIASKIRGGDELIRYLTYVRGQSRSTSGREVVPSVFEREQKRVALSCYQSQIAYTPTAPWFGDDQREFVL